MLSALTSAVYIHDQRLDFIMEANIHNEPL